ncbi:MAG TPA: hypothetical protein PLV72_00730 [Candidatus Magasanikbacteria bacterium]|nr:hypothetical protein [Candidatus Magasanikbacteria bacterium]
MDSLLNTIIIIGVAVIVVILSSCVIVGFIKQFFLDFLLAITLGKEETRFFISSRPKTNKNPKFRWRHFLKPFFLRPIKTIRLLSEMQIHVNFLVIPIHIDPHQAETRKKLFPGDATTPINYLPVFGRDWNKTEKTVFFMMCYYYAKKNPDQQFIFFSSDTQNPYTLECAHLWEISEKANVPRIII